MKYIDLFEKTMNIKLFLVVFLFMALDFSAHSQELKVTGFDPIDGSPLAVRFPEYDVRGEDLCGLVILYLPIPEATFPDARKSLYKDKEGEWWVYLTKGSKWITIKTIKYPPLKHDFVEPIESKVTYRMTIEIPPDPITIKNSSAMWRSAIFPGWGQFYKNRNGRGTLIVIGETLTLAAGGLSLYNEIKQKNNMDKPEVSYQDYIAAEKSYEQWNTARHISFITAAVIYALNLADAYFTPAKPQKNLTFAPNVLNTNGELAVGATLSIRF